MLSCVILTTASGTLSSAPDRTDPLEVNVAFTLHELRHDPEQPDSFFLRFRLALQWEPRPGLAWNPWTDLRFSNRVGEIRRTRVVATGRGSAGEAPLPVEGCRETWLLEGNFKSYNDFREFPLDDHQLGVILLSRSLTPQELRFVSNAERLNVRPTFPGRIEGWTLVEMGFYDRSDRFLHSIASTEDGKLPAFAAWEFLVERDRNVVFVQVFLPMSILWLFSYLGFFWKGDSPASRFSTAAMFAAIALYLGIRSFSPEVGYLLAIHSLFLVLYFSIGLNALFATFVHHLNDTGRVSRAERLRCILMIVSPVLPAILVAVVLNYGDIDIKDAIFEGEPIVRKDADYRTETSE